MRSFSQNDFLSHEFHDLIELIYDSVTSQEGFFPFLRRFIDIFHGHSASFAIYNVEGNDLVGAWTINIPNDALAFYSEHVSHRDVLVETAIAVRRQGDLRFIASNLDLGPDARKIRQETRAGEWLESYGASEAAGAIAYMDGCYLNFFGMQRNGDQPAFSREELRIFDGFLPHINRAVGLYTRLGRQSFEPIAERLALDRVNRGMLVCDATFRVVFRNTMADRILKQDGGIRLSSEGTLAIYGSESTGQFSLLVSSAVAASIDQRDEEDRVLQIKHGLQRLTLVITPLLSDGGEGSLQGKGALITIHDWSDQPPINPELFQGVFGLTEAECRIALQLMEGLCLKEIADLSGRSRETIKYHLNSLFRKTDTRRQGELISLLSRSGPTG